MNNFERNQMKQLQAVIYSRFSPRRNAAECESCNQQIQRCRAYCEAHGWKIAGEYRDEAMSGASMENRPGLFQALKHVCSIRGVLVCRSLSRLARNVKETFDIADKLKRNKSNLATIKEHIDTSDMNGRFVFVIFAGLAELEREQIAERTSEAMMIHQANGKVMSNNVPYGCERDPIDRSRMVPNAREQKIIRIIMRLNRRGTSLRGIAKWLNDKGIKARPKALEEYNEETGKYQYVKDENGDYVTEDHPWAHPTIRKIVKREAAH